MISISSIMIGALPVSMCVTPRIRISVPMVKTSELITAGRRCQDPARRRCSQN